MNTHLDTHLGRCLVTGAAGLVGRNLIRTLLARGCRVRALVHSTPLQLEHEELECVSGDVRDRDAMSRACDGIDTVFHTAARIALLGGRAVTEKYKRLTYDINVAGTANVVEACRERGVARLVYTSSVDVCFEGKHIEHMDRTTPYAKRTKCVYADTKIAAEQLVLEANGSDGLLTCALRVDGIYAPEANLIFDALLEQIVHNRLKVCLGDAATLQDTSYIDNLIHGHLLAAEHLVPGGSACGNAYFITDNEPQNTFEFIRPVVEGLGYEVPRWRLPRGLLLPILKLWEYLHFRLGIASPLLCPHELDKATVTHYGDIDDARRDLGYEPIKTVEEALQECLPYCKEALAKAREQMAAK
jgi:3beta-hydroxy-delta5-steroid dehydrogenase/steroid delta-isomerase